MKRIKVFKPQKGIGGMKFNGKAHIDAMYKDPKWIAYSRKYLEINPRCYCCGNPSQAVDHLKAHKGDKTLFWTLNNMLCLCHKCHNTATALFDRFPVQKYNEKLAWLARCRSINQLSFKVMVVPV